MDALLKDSLSLGGWSLMGGTYPDLMGRVTSGTIRGNQWDEAVRACVWATLVSFLSLANPATNYSYQL